MPLRIHACDSLAIRASDPAGGSGTGSHQSTTSCLYLRDEPSIYLVPSAKSKGYRCRDKKKQFCAAWNCSHVAPHRTSPKASEGPAWESTLCRLPPLRHALLTLVLVGKKSLSGCLSNQLGGARTTSKRRVGSRLEGASRPAPSS